MKRYRFVTLIASVVASTLLVFSPALADTEKPPQDGCVAVPKIQYDYAKQQYLLTNSYGTYLRTGLACGDELVLSIDAALTRWLRSVWNQRRLSAGQATASKGIAVCT